MEEGKPDSLFLDSFITGAWPAPSGDVGMDGPLGLSAREFGELASEIKLGSLGAQGTLPTAANALQGLGPLGLGDAGGMAGAARSGEDPLTRALLGNAAGLIPQNPNQNPLIPDSTSPPLPGGLPSQQADRAQAEASAQISRLYNHRLMQLPVEVQRRAQQHLILRTAAVRSAGVPVQQGTMLVQQELLPLMQQAFMRLSGGREAKPMPPLSGPVGTTINNNPAVAATPGVSAGGANNINNTGANDARQNTAAGMLQLEMLQKQQQQRQQQQRQQQQQQQSLARLQDQQQQQQNLARLQEQRALLQAHLQQQQQLQAASAKQADQQRQAVLLQQQKQIEQLQRLQAMHLQHLQAQQAQQQQQQRNTTAAGGGGQQQQQQPPSHLNIPSGQQPNNPPRINTSTKQQLGTNSNTNKTNKNSTAAGGTAAGNLPYPLHPSPTGGPGSNGDGLADAVHDAKRMRTDSPTYRQRQLQEQQKQQQQQQQQLALNAFLPQSLASSAGAGGLSAAEYQALTNMSLGINNNTSSGGLMNPLSALGFQVPDAAVGMSGDGGGNGGVSGPSGNTTRGGGGANVGSLGGAGSEFRQLSNSDLEMLGAAAVTRAKVAAAKMQASIIYFLFLRGFLFSGVFFHFNQ